MQPSHLPEAKYKSSCQGLGEAACFQGSLLSAPSRGWLAGLVLVWWPHGLPTSICGPQRNSDLQRLVDCPLLKPTPKKGQPPDVPSPTKAGEDVPGKAFHPRSKQGSSCNGLWSVPGPLLDCQVLVSLVNGILGRIE